VRALTFSGGLGYTDFKFLSLTPQVTAGSTEFLPQYRPKWTINLAAQYDSEPIVNDSYVTARVDANYRSSQTALGGVLSSLSPVEQVAFKQAAVIDAYWLVNGRVALNKLELGGISGSVALWAKNLLNDRSLAYAISFGQTIAGDYERARTYGIDLTVEF
jgi:iron complex outermembrane receptor protein